MYIPDTPSAVIGVRGGLGGGEPQTDPGDRNEQLGWIQSRGEGNGASMGMNNSNCTKERQKYRK